MKTIKISVISLVILNLLVPAVIFAQPSPSMHIPETIDEVKDMGNKTVDVMEKGLPGIIKSTWENEVLPIWRSIYSWFRAHIWDNWLGPKVSNVWQSIVRIFKGEVEERKEGVGEEFEKEKGELKEEAPVVGKSLWDKFMDFIK
ncbi:MAG: hypothetical protein V1756_00415 [Patescibacteria group bacterium]